MKGGLNSMRKCGFASFGLVLLFLSQLIASEGMPVGYQYIFPVPGAKYVHPATTIIIRFEYISPAMLSNLSSLVMVIGEKSGQHAGKTIVASDNRTIIFKPEQNYEPGESVKVIIQPLFLTTPKTSVKPLSYEFRTLVEGMAKPRQRNEVEPDLHELKRSREARQPRIMSNGVSVPSDFPHVKITKNTNPSDAYIFLNNMGPPSYNIIFDTSGDPVWYWKTPDNRRDFKVQSNGLITMLIRDSVAGSARGFLVLNENFEFIKSITATNGYATDEHELFMLPDSGYFLIGRRETQVDMSQYVTGGQRNATVRETCIQEFTADDQLIFIWRAWDHFDIRDVEIENLRGNYIRFPHMNAIYIDEDEHILLSSRHLSEISKIHRQSGAFIWRLCGTPASANNDFTFVDDPLQGFRSQHAIRSNGNNRYLLFDNGNLHSPPVSRAVEYTIDTVQMTATRVWEFRNDVPNNYSYYMGNAQRLPNGNTHINWAVGDVLPIAQEVTASGDKVFEMQFEAGYHCYRSFRHSWKGNVSAPYLMLEPQADNLTLLFNKFGDADIQFYKIYGGTSPNPTALIDTSRSTLKRLKNLENGQRYYFRVSAVNNNGVEGELSNEESVVVNIAQPGSNFILNNDFSNNAESWIWEVAGPASAQLQVENGVCHIIIQNAGTQIYDVQLRQNGIPLIQGQNYTFEFDAWAEAIRAVEIKVGQDISPFTNYSRIGYTALYTTPKKLVYRFQMQEPTDNNARVVINAGIYSPGIYVDNFSLKMEVETGVDEQSSSSNSFMLYSNYPNPFNPTTYIKYKLPELSSVSLIIFNLQGQKVRTLRENDLEIGLQTVELNASNLPSGIYFYKLAAQSRSSAKMHSFTKKMILMK